MVPIRLDGDDDDDHDGYCYWHESFYFQLLLHIFFLPRPAVAVMTTLVFSMITTHSQYLGGRPRVWVPGFASCGKCVLRCCSSCFDFYEWA